MTRLLDADALQFFQDIAADELLVEKTPVAAGGPTISLLDQHHNLLSRPLSLPVLMAAASWSTADDVEDGSQIADSLVGLRSQEAASLLGNHGSNSAAACRSATRAIRPTPSSFEASSTTTITAPPKTQRKKPKRSPHYDPNHARNKRRRELISLHEKVAEMEQQLKRLRDATPTPLVSALPPCVDLRCTTTKETLVEPQTGEPQWQRVAEHERDKRRCAERENEQLKHVLETQRRIADSLEQLQHERETLEVSRVCELSVHLRRVSTKPDEDELHNLLNQAYACFMVAGASMAGCNHECMAADGQDTLLSELASDDTATP